MALTGVRLQAVEDVLEELRDRLHSANVVISFPGTDLDDTQETEFMLYWKQMAAVYGDLVAYVETRLASAEVTSKSTARRIATQTDPEG